MLMANEFKLFSATFVAVSFWRSSVFRGVVRVDDLVPLAAIAAILGGIAAAGSNVRTLREATADMRAAEARRTELIGGLPFSAVIDEAKS